MRAWVYRSRGTPAEVLKLENGIPKPTASQLEAHDVLVKINYVSLFQGQAMLIAQTPKFTTTPCIPETTFSGTVIATGHEVSHLQTDDEVFGGFGRNILSKYGGVLADYAILPDSVVRRKPNNISVRDVSGMGSAGVTAIQFAEVTNLKAGDRVLVTGASSGTGSLVVQAVRSVIGESGYIIGTCSANNEKMVKDLGVDEIIDYTTQPILHTYLQQKYARQPFNAIIDITGTDPLLYPNSPSYLTPTGSFLFAGNMSLVHGGGTLLSILYWQLSVSLTSIWPVILGGTPRKCISHRGILGGDGLDKLARLIEQGKMRPVIDSVFEMEDVLEGYERLATRRARGKVIVHVQD